MLLSVTAMADSTTANMNIESIETAWTKDGIVIRVSNPAGGDYCSDEYRVWSDHPMHKELVSILLSALHSDKSVDFRVKDECRSNRLEVIAVKINK